jgi:large subunit ribosomal protein L4
MEIKVNGAEAIKVSEEAFNSAYNESLIHQVVIAFLAGARSGTKQQKSRSDVSGGGKKPWRQKGTGRARAGTSRSPIWRSGGATFAARPRSYEQKINRKMYRGAMRSIFSELLRAGRLHVVDSFKVEQPKTKEMVNKLSQLNVKNALLVSTEIDKNTYLSMRNIPNVDARDVQSLDPVALVTHENVVITAEAIKLVEEMLA